ncbi:MAG: GerMN domain-containing protein [Spirochaetales bacterium]
MNDPSNTNKKKQAGVVAVFWIVLALVIFIAFLIKQDDIVRTLKETDFFIHVFGVEPEFISEYKIAEPEIVVQSGITLSETVLLAPTQRNTESTVEEAVSPEVIDTAVNIVDESSIPTEPVMPVAPSVSSASDETPVVETRTETVYQYVYFISVNGDGSIERKESVRSVPKTSTPLTDALKALLAGPNSDESSKGYISLIPEKSELISASIRDRIATVNFTEDFAFNRYGVEGYLGQLIQVVYTATAFNTIDSVQFLIEGENMPYLGGDGVWIGTPLTRESFK